MGEASLCDDLSSPAVGEGTESGRPAPAVSAVVNQQWKGAEARWEESLLRGLSQAGRGGVNTACTMQTLALVPTAPR